jgi:alcohol dehydrogenase class IV
MLPHTTEALRRRFPDGVDERAVADAARLVERFGTTRLRDLGVGSEQLDACVTAAASRAELALTPPPAGEDELREIYAAAW